MFPCFVDTYNDIPFEQAPVTDILMQSICGDVGAYWRDLGTFLGLESAVMDNIETDIIECRERAWKVLRKWKQKSGKKATVTILINALKKTERKDVAEKLGM